MNRFDFQDIAKKPVTVPTQKKGPSKAEGGGNWSDPRGDNLHQGNPVMPRTAESKVKTYRQVLQTSDNQVEEFTIHMVVITIVPTICLQSYCYCYMLTAGLLGFTVVCRTSVPV